MISYLFVTYFIHKIISKFASHLNFCILSQMHSIPLLLCFQISVLHLTHSYFFVLIQIIRICSIQAFLIMLPSSKEFEGKYLWQQLQIKKNRDVLQ